MSKGYPGLMRSRFMRLPEVVRLTGVSRSKIYRWMAEGDFPKQIPLGGNAVAWLERGIYDWIQKRLIKRITLRIHLQELSRCWRTFVVGWREDFHVKYLKLYI